MGRKKDAMRVGRPNMAKVISVNNHVLSIHGKRKIVNLDLERQGEIIGGVVGGLALGAGIFLLSIILPILLG